MDDATSPQPRRRWLRWVLWALVAVMAAAVAGVGWYVSGEIMAGLRAAPEPITYDTDVLAVNDGEIVLSAGDEPSALADRDAWMGLRWEGGYGQVGPAIAFGAETETRPFVLLQGSPPPIGPLVADFDTFAFPPDPSVLGVEVQTVSYPAPLGRLEAWYVPGSGSTWIVAVHGRGADRTEFLRLIEAAAPLRYPMLVIRYRNDPDAPAANDSLILAGQEEWRDVAAAVDHALAEGATDVVVYGASMGGALTLGYAMEEEREVIRGLILEAPAADLREIVRLRSGEALPVGGVIGDSLLAVGRGFAWLRTRLDFDTVDYTARADELRMPVLMWHGTDDTTVPFAIGEDLAGARPDLVEFHPLPDAEHVRAWNEDPAAYAAVLEAYLARLGRAP